jgi:Tol biopolymer transport system component
LISANEPDHGVRLWIQGIEDARPRAISPEGYRGFNHGVSPDGKFVAVTGPDQRFYLYPIEGGEPTPIPGLLPGEVVRGWAPDGESLLVDRRGDVPSKVFAVHARSGRREVWRELIPPDPAGISTIGGLAVRAGGRAYAYSYVRSLADLYVVEGLR